MEITKLKGFEEHFEIMERVAARQGKDINIFINEAVKTLVEDMPKAQADLKTCYNCIEMLRNKVVELSDKQIKTPTNNIYKLKLLEKTRVKNIEIMRVPGGWIFDNGKSMVFVGWCDDDD